MLAPSSAGSRGVSSSSLPRPPSSEEDESAQFEEFRRKKLRFTQMSSVSSEEEKGKEKEEEKSEEEPCAPSPFLLPFYYHQLYCIYSILFSLRFSRSIFFLLFGLNGQRPVPHFPSLPRFRRIPVANFLSLLVLTIIRVSEDSTFARMMMKEVEEYEERLRREEEKMRKEEERKMRRRTPNNSEEEGEEEAEKKKEEKQSRSKRIQKQKKVSALAPIPEVPAEKEGAREGKSKRNPGGKEKEKDKEKEKMEEAEGEEFLQQEDGWVPPQPAVPIPADSISAQDFFSQLLSAPPLPFAQPTQPPSKDPLAAEGGRREGVGALRILQEPQIRSQQRLVLVRSSLPPILFSSPPSLPLLSLYLSCLIASHRLRSVLRRRSLSGPRRRRPCSSPSLPAIPPSTPSTRSPPPSASPSLPALLTR